MSNEAKWLCRKCSRANSLTTCNLCQKSTGDKFIIDFTRERYNLNSNYVKKSIETLSDNTAKYQICSTCDRKLMQHSMLNCCLCERLCASRELREVKDQIMICKALTRETQKKDGLLICIQCQGELMDKVKCIVCDELKPKNNTQPFKRDRYRPNKLVETIVDESECDRICQVCDNSLMHIYTCTCCHEKFNKGSIMLFEVKNYDMTNYVVSCALATKYRYSNEMGEYICTKCDKCLSQMNGNVPKMPRKAIAKQLHDPGHKFLQAIHEKPEFVCTCCHRWLFWRAVINYSDQNYDMRNPIVCKTLDKKYRHQMEVIVVKGIRSAHEDAVDYSWLSESENSASDSDVDDTSALTNVTLKKYEYICKTCHNKLKRKKPEMPAQACANGLELASVPPELQNLSDLE